MEIFNQGVSQGTFESLNFTGNAKLAGNGGRADISITQSSSEVQLPRSTNNTIADTQSINSSIITAGVGGVISAPGFLNKPYSYNGILPLLPGQTLLLNGAQIKQPDQVSSTLTIAATVSVLANNSGGGSTAPTFTLNTVSGHFVGEFVCIQDNSNLANFTVGSRPTFSTTGPLMTGINIAQITAINGNTTPYFSATGAGTVTVQFTTLPSTESSITTPSFGFQGKSVSVLSNSYSEAQIPFVSTSGSTNASTAHITLGAANICVSPGMSATSSAGVGTGAGQIPANTIVLAVSGTDVTLSANTGSAASGLTFTFGASYTFPVGTIIASLTQLFDTFPSTSGVRINDFEFNGNAANNVTGIRWELSPNFGASLSRLESGYIYDFPGDGLLISGRYTTFDELIIERASGGGLHMSGMPFTYNDPLFNNNAISGLNESICTRLTVNSCGMEGSAYNGHLNGNSAQVSATNYQMFYNALQCSNNESEINIEGYHLLNDYGSVMCCGLGHVNYSGNTKIALNSGEIRGMTNGAFAIYNSNGASGVGLPPEDIAIRNTDVYECGPQNSPAQQTAGGFLNLQRNQCSTIGSVSGGGPLATRITIDNVNFINSPLSVQGALNVTIKAKHIVTDIAKSSSLIIEQCSGPVVGSDAVIDCVCEEPEGNPALTFTQAGTTASTTTITLGAPNANVGQGQVVTSSDGGLPAGTKVVSYDGNVTVVVTAPATTSASVTFTFGGGRFGWQAQYSTQAHINGSALTNTDAQVTRIQISSAKLTNGSSSVTGVTVPSATNYPFSNVTNGMEIRGQGIPDGIFVQSVAGSSPNGSFTLSQYNASGTIVPWLYTGNTGIYPLLIGTQKLVQVRGKISHRGGGTQLIVTSGAKVDLDIKSVNPYNNLIIHKSYQFRCKYKIDSQLTEGFITAIGTVLYDFGQDNSNSSTGYGNVDVDITSQACINANGWGVFGLRLPANSTLTSTFTGIIRGFTTNSATGQLFKPLLYPASVSTTGSKNEFNNLRIGSTRASDQAFAVNGTDVGIPNVLGTPIAPTTVVNTAGAGVGGTASIAAGTDNDHQLQVVTGGTPTASSTITVTTFSQPYGQIPLVDITPANAAAAGLAVGSFPIGTATINGVTVTSGTIPLPPGVATYLFNVSVRDVSRNNK